jgi:hypothetical protein
MKRIYGATTAGKGATYGWEGNGNVGSGSMEILNAPAPSQVTIKLDFMKPFEAHNVGRLHADAERPTAPPSPGRCSARCPTSSRSSICS